MATTPSNCISVYDNILKANMTYSLNVGAYDTPENRLKSAMTSDSSTNSVLHI